MTRQQFFSEDTFEKLRITTFYFALYVDLNASSFEIIYRKTFNVKLMIAIIYSCKK